MRPPDRPSLPEAVTRGRVVAIARRCPPQRARRLAETLWEEGIHVLEITMEGEGAAEALAAAAGTIVVGAGTVLDQATAETALAAGASFLIAPHTDPGLVRWAAGRGVPLVPGALSPTEVVAGWSAGAAAVKVFPASVGGPELVRHLRGPFPDIPFLPSGGVDDVNAPSYLAAGAVAVGVGGWLTGDERMEVVAHRARALVAAIAPTLG